MPYFNHERLQAYQLAVSVAKSFRQSTFPRGFAHLRDQGLRASESMVLNIAEGGGRRGKSQNNHFSIASGSASEVCAVLDLVDLAEGPEMQAKLRIVGAMLYRLGG